MWGRTSISGNDEQTCERLHTSHRRNALTWKASNNVLRKHRVQTHLARERTLERVGENIGRFETIFRRLTLVESILGRKKAFMFVHWFPMLLVFILLSYSPR